MTEEEKLCDRMFDWLEETNPEFEQFHMTRHEYELCILALNCVKNDADYHRIKKLNGIEEVLEE